MGGSGSGRIGGKTCTEDLLSFDVRRWQRDGLLQAGRAFVSSWTRRGETIASISIRVEAGRLFLDYRQKRGDEWKPERYPVSLDWTPCTYGGARAWFRCPAAGCGRRVAILYSGRGIFACRHCHCLGYRSQRETHGDRMGRRADKLRDRLGWTPGRINGHGDKPKGMRWRTYFDLVAQHDRLALANLQAMAERLGIVNGRLERLEVSLKG